MESLKFDVILNRACSDKLAQILSEGGATNIEIGNGYRPDIKFVYKNIHFTAWICYGNCTVRIQPTDGTYRSQFNTLQINTMFQKLDKLVRNGYEREQI